jgi:effector-binding domain-containing protein
VLTEPRIVDRTEQPYVAIKASVTMETIGRVLPELHPNVFGWLAERDIRPAGAPFWKYDVIDMERELVVEVGVPVDKPATGDDRVLTGVLPAGRYASATHTGHPSGLMEATAKLLAWADDKGLSWDKTSAVGGGEAWGARLEIYDTNPDDEPDMDKWETELAFLLAD